MGHNAGEAAGDQRADILNMAASDGTVTLFFSDIENSTPLNDRLGDATWVQVLAAHDKVVRTRIEQYRGQVVKTAGDGFMVRSATPRQPAARPSASSATSAGTPRSSGTGRSRCGSASTPARWWRATATVELVEMDAVELKGLSGEHMIWRILPAAA